MPARRTTARPKRNTGVRVSIRKRRPAARASRTIRTGRNGSRPGNGQKLQHVVKHGLNAFSKVHLPLPVSAGPYLTVTTRRNIVTTDFLQLYAPQKLASGAHVADDWSNYVGLSMPTSTDTINGSSWKFKTAPSPGVDIGGFFECVPSAFSVQVISPASLTSAAGIVHIGRTKGTLSNPDSADARTGQDLADSLLSYSEPRTLPVAKLSLGAVQTNAVPSNMSELQDFEVISSGADSSVKVVWGQGNNFAGFNPIYIINPNAAELNVTIAVEWRVRVSPFNPMHAAGTLHPPTPPGLWHSILDAAHNAGHGVEEVAGVAGGGAAVLAAGGFEAAADAAMAYAGSVAMSALEFAPLMLL
jgi:hypothetical protein